MARITPDDVKSIIQVDERIKLTGFIETASALINRVKTCAASRRVSLSEDELRLLEMWVAAHLYAIRDQQYQSKNTGKAGATFQGQTGMRLESTYYGQTALTLDASGCLQTQSKATVVQFGWLGEEYQ